jgi:hypothetical protein
MLKWNLKQLKPTQAESAAPSLRSGSLRSPSLRCGAADYGAAATAPVPDPEVPARPRRRQFTAEHKRSILDDPGRG